jgi:transcriptional regulator with XRE-family HTH domain
MPRSVKPEVLIAYGTALREARTAARLSQDGLIDQALQAGVKAPDRAYLSSLENGHQEVGLGMQFRLAGAIGVRPSEMLRKAEDMLLPLSERERLDRSGAAKIFLDTETCPGCKTVYSRYTEKVKSRQRGKFRCPRCKQPLASWLGTFRLLYETRRRPKAMRTK